MDNHLRQYGARDQWIAYTEDTALQQQAISSKVAFQFLVSFLLILRLLRPITDFHFLDIIIQESTLLLVDLLDFLLALVGS